MSAQHSTTEFDPMAAADAVDELEYLLQNEPDSNRYYTKLVADLAKITRASSARLVLQTSQQDHLLASTDQPCVEPSLRIEERLSETDCLVLEINDPFTPSHLNEPSHRELSVAMLRLAGQRVCRDAYHRWRPNQDDPWLRQMSNQLVQLSVPNQRARAACRAAAEQFAADRVWIFYVSAADVIFQGCSGTQTVDTQGLDAARCRKLAEQLRGQATDLFFDADSSGEGAIESSVDEHFQATGATSLRMIGCLAHPKQDSSWVTILEWFGSEPRKLARDENPHTATPDPLGWPAALATFLHEPDRSITTTKRPTSFWHSYRRRVVMSLLLLGLLCVPVPLRYSVQGTVQPTRVFRAFSPAGATLIELPVQDGQLVKAGELLAKLHQPEMLLQREQLQADLASAEAEALGLRLTSATTANRENSANQRDGLSPRRRLGVLRTQIESLHKQRQHLDDVLDSLNVVAPHAGQVVLRLGQAEALGQVVSHGQWLLDVVDPAAGYHVELEVPDDLLVTVRKRWETLGNRMSVPLHSPSAPNTPWTGTVERFARVHHETESGEHVVTMMVPLDSLSNANKTATPPRIDSVLHAKLNMGNRMLIRVIADPLLRWWEQR